MASPLESDSVDLRALSVQAVDPASSLPSFTFESAVTPSRLGLKGLPAETQIVYRPAIPFSVLGTSSVLRVSLPYAAASGRGSDAGNVEVMDLLTVSNKWGHWGAGAVATFGETRGLGINTFRAGPAVSFVVDKSGWVVGALNKNVFSANAAQSAIQPILGYHLSNGWSIGTGDLQYRIDWKRRALVSVPVAFEVAKVLEHDSRYYRVSVEPLYRFGDLYGSPRWGVLIRFAILGPNM